jgi:REP element-mobilizing transposase RayT
MGSKRPPRLCDFDYRGIYGYSLTICAFDRRRHFESNECVEETLAHLLRTGADYRFVIVAYCFMPDHLHALVDATAVDSDFRKFTSMFKQRAAYAYRRSDSEPLWQEGYYDRVLRSDEAHLPVAAYIVANPLRANLCKDLREYPFFGSERYTRDELIEAVQANASTPRP